MGFDRRNLQRCRHSRHIDAADSLSNAQLRLAEEAYLLFRDGQLEEDYWLTRAALALGTLNSPELRRNYEMVKEAGWFTSEFVEWVDARLAIQSNQ